jgi:hypothetical protein
VLCCEQLVFKKKTDYITWKEQFNTKDIMGGNENPNREKKPKGMLLVASSFLSLFGALHVS